ncbi:hypothetical protein ACFL1G_04185 [Planctomycetota bacterium]
MANLGKSFVFSGEQGVSTSKEIGVISRDDGCKLTGAVFLVLFICLFGSSALGQYCSASGGCNDNIQGNLNIDSVTVGNISNTGTGCQGGYSDYTSLSTSMAIGQSYPITVTDGNWYDDGDQCRYGLTGTRMVISVMQASFLR